MVTLTPVAERLAVELSLSFNDLGLSRLHGIQTPNLSPYGANAVTDCATAAAVLFHNNKSKGSLFLWRPSLISKQFTHM